MNQSLTYTVTDIEEVLGIGRSTAYNLMKDPPFPIIKIGKCIRIPKESFHKWLTLM